MTLDMP